MADTREKLIFQIQVEDSNALKRLKTLQGQSQLLKEDQRDLNKQYKEGKLTLEQYSAATAELKLEQKAVGTELRRTQKEVTAQTDSTVKQRIELQRLTQEYDNLSKSLPENSTKLKSLKSQINDLTDAIKGSEEGTQRFQRNVGNYQSAFDGIKGSLSGLTSAFTVAGAAAFGAELIAEGIGQAIEYGKQLVEIRRETETLTQTSGAELNALAGRVAATADVFEQDYLEVLKAGNALSREFEESQNSVQDDIQAGLALTGKQGGEFLEIIKEYGPQFNQAGASASEFIAIASQQITQGTFSDKGIDSIKEVTERLGLADEAALKTLDTLGIDRSDLQDKGILAVVKDASARIGELPEGSIKAQKAIEGLFGTPGLDAGRKYIETLGELELNLDTLVGRSTAYQIKQLELVNAQEKWNQVSQVFISESGGIFTNLIADAKIFLFEGLVKLARGTVDLANGFIELYNNSLPVRATFEFLGAWFSSVRTLAKAFFSQMLSGFGTVAKVASKVLQLDFKGAKSAVGDFFTDTKDRIVNTGATIGNNFADAYEDTLKGRLKTIDFDSLLEVPETSTTGGESGFVPGVQVNDVATVENKSFTGGISGDALSKIKASKEAELQLINDFESQRIELLDQIALQDVERVQQTEEEKKRIQEEFQQLERDRRTAELEEFQEDFNLKTGIAQSYADAIVGFSELVVNSQDEESKAYKRAKQVQKVAATASVGISAAQAIVAAVLAGQKLASQIQPAPVGAAIGIAYTVGQVAAIVAQKVKQVSEISKAEKGAIVPAGGGIAQGPSHTQGGIFGLVGGAPVVNFQGQEWIVNAQSSQRSGDALAMINANPFTKFAAVPVAAKGMYLPMLQGGGTVPRNISQSPATVDSISNLGARIDSLEMVVAVDDIITQTSAKVKVMDRANV